ncbi:unnamed protein product [Brachionus calyciflorus]|uniref:Bis(5'-nucleosyl)-tetraphosphatase [asymmetrical] n=1 Tax=Brachionus calyciflorus TaxID=104777 RepID=A0A814ASS4_9BILA|nr:unnamed protein product [Brachionus calyciflorus]
MTQKLAAGLIIYRKLAESIEYLLLQTSYSENHWTPPKGHLDEGEDYLTAAVRETEEEAGLKEDLDYTFLSKTFSIECNYVIKGKEPKKVLYWIAKMLNPNTEIKLSHEHINYKWLKLSDACEITKYDEMKCVLNRADTFIINNMKN